MALDNYTDLLAEIGDHLNRQDLAAKIPTFIRLAEAKFERKMRTYQMVRRMYANTFINPLTGAYGEYLPLPGDYKELKRACVINASLKQPPLEYATMADIDRLQRCEPEGNMPTAYAIVGNAMRLGPFPDAQYTIEISYYAKLPKLTVKDQVNWLLADHPDYYLYASLLAAAPYLKDDDRMPLWQDVVEGPVGASGTRDGGLLEEIRLANERAEQGGAPLRARLKQAYGGSFY